VISQKLSAIIEVIRLNILFSGDRLARAAVSICA
jgi:hypothetical protein